MDSLPVIQARLLTQEAGPLPSILFFCLAPVFHPHGKSPVRVPGKPLAARPQGLSAAAACRAPCLPRSEGPQLAARRCQLRAAGASSRRHGRRCRPLAGRQRPMPPTSDVPIPGRLHHAVWLGPGARAQCDEVLPLAPLAQSPP